jgi:hypothetical protein
VTDSWPGLNQLWRFVRMARLGRITAGEADNGKVVISYKAFLYGSGEGDLARSGGQRDGKGAGREERRMTFSLGRLWDVVA